MFDMRLTCFKLTSFFLFFSSTNILVNSTISQIYGINCGKTLHYPSMLNGKTNQMQEHATHIDLQKLNNRTKSDDPESNLNEHNLHSFARPLLGLPAEATLHVYNEATLKLREHVDGDESHNDEPVNTTVALKITGGKIADIRNYPFFALLELQDRRDLTH